MAALANDEHFGPLLRRPLQSNSNSDEQFNCFHQFSFHLTSLLNICFALALLVTVPIYNDFYIVTKSDSFSSLYFVVGLSTLLLVLLTSVPAISNLRKLCTTSYAITNDANRCSSIKTIVNILTDSLIFTASLLCLSYCRDKGRIPCHLQDGLLFLAVPVAIAYMALIKRKKNVSSDGIRLIGYLAIYMGLVFVSTIFQSAYRFTCRGSTIARDPNSESLTKKLWMGAYVVSIALFTSCLSNFLSNLQNDSARYSRCLRMIAWIHITVFLMLSALFWTNLFPSVGGLEIFSLEEFWTRFQSIWLCHFTDDCISLAKIGYVVIGLWFLLMITSSLLLLKYQSNPVVVLCNACLALPLLPVFYGLFRPDLLGVVAPLGISANGIIGIVAFLGGYTCLSLYHKEQRMLTLNNYFNIF